MTVFTDHNLFEEKGELKRIRTEVPLLTSLTPCRWAKPTHRTGIHDVELHVLGCRVDILGTNCDQCVSIVQCCFASTETVRFIRTDSPEWPPRLSHSAWTLTGTSK